MVHPRDLRIGNYVSIPDRGKIEPYYITTKITQVLHNEVKTEYHKYTDSCLCINPIPLTEDILLRCGMKIVDAGDYKTTCIKCGVLILFADSSNNFTTLEDCSNKYCISYLHELQNLFYDLTKTELNVQL